MRKQLLALYLWKDPLTSRQWKALKATSSSNYPSLQHIHENIKTSLSDNLYEFFHMCKFSLLILRLIWIKSITGL